MAKKKISKKVQQAAEKYLASLDSSREQLTDKQWEVFINYIKTERNFKMFMPILFLLMIVMACCTIHAFKFTNKSINKIVPDEVVYVRKATDESTISLEPSQIEEHLEWIRDLSSNTALLFMGTVLIATVFFIRIFFKKYRLKSVEALVQRK